MFINPVPEDQAPAAVAEMYETDHDRWGFLPNFTRAFSHHPRAYAAWLQLVTSVRATVIEALGAQADPELTDMLEDDLLKALLVGRPPAAMPRPT